MVCLQAAMEPRGSGEDGFGQGAWVTTDKAAKGIHCSRPFLAQDVPPGELGQGLQSAERGVREVVGTWPSRSDGGCGSASEVVFLDTVCGMTAVYMLQCLGVKGEGRGAACLSPRGQPFPPAGTLQETPSGRRGRPPGPCKLRSWPLGLLLTGHVALPARSREAAFPKQSGLSETVALCSPFPGPVEAARCSYQAFFSVWSPVHRRLPPAGLLRRRAQTRAPAAAPGRRATLTDRSDESSL